MYCGKFKKTIGLLECTTCSIITIKNSSCDFLTEDQLEPGKKFDNGKIQYDLIPPECIEELAKVLTHGAKKYAPNNWKQVDPFNERYYSALMRHLEAWRKGEEKDAESGLNHLSHVLTNAAFLLWKNLQK